MSRIAIHCGSLRVEIAPEFGAAITRLTLGAWEVLRPAPADLRHPFETANFVMLPYANRIANGRLKFGEVDVTLPPNIAGERHPLHGVGIGMAWQVEESTHSSVTLRLDHAVSPSWPWPFQACQHVVVDTKGVTFETLVKNVGSTTMPLGMGFHPFFPNARQASVHAHLTGVWDIDDQQLPTTLRPAPLRPWSEGCVVQNGGTIDHCHVGWDGVATITWPGQGRRVRLVASAEMRFLHIYTTPEKDFFCLEPVSHWPDAINATGPSADQLIALLPGATQTMSMRLEPGQQPG